MTVALTNPGFIVALMSLTAAALVGGWFDLRYRRIPNWLPAITAVAGLLVAAWIEPATILSNGLHMLIALVVGMVLFGIRVFGGGDAKFYAGVAAWFSLNEAIVLLVSVTLCGLALLIVWFTVRRLAGVKVGGTDRTGLNALPYGIAIGTGAVLALQF